MGATAVADAFINVETADSPDGFEYATWLALLDNPRNRKGLVRIELQRFHGRSGMRTFRQMHCTMEDGEAVESPGDTAALDPDAVAAQLYDAAIQDGKRQGCDTYRVQLYKVKGTGKNRATVAGEYAGLRFNVITGESVWGPEQGSSPADAWKDIAEFMRDTLKDVLAQQGACISAATGTMISAVHAGDVLTQQRIEHAARVEQLAPTPAETNERWRLGLNTLTHTARELVRFSIWNKTGNMPPSGETFDVGATEKNDDDDGALQTELRGFFDGLNDTQKDQLRKKMGADNFKGLGEVLSGDLQNFQANFPLMGTMLGGAIHRGDLKDILTNAELLQLCKIFGTDPPA